MGGMVNELRRHEVTGGMVNELQCVGGRIAAYITQGREAGKATKSYHNYQVHLRMDLSIMELDLDPIHRGQLSLLLIRCGVRVVLNSHWLQGNPRISRPNSLYFSYVA